MAEESFFQLVGSYSAVPAFGAPSADPDVTAGFDERLKLAKKHVDVLNLAADAFAPVALGGLSNVHVLVVKCPGRRCVLRLTSAAGSQQLVPVEELAILVSISVPFTAIDVQRAAGVITIVKVFLGEKA